MRDQILVLNYDNAASQAVTRKLRSERVLAKIVPGRISLREIQAQEPLGLVLAGPADGGEIPALGEQILLSGLPVLALGVMASALLTALGGQADAPSRPASPARLSGRELFACMEGTERTLPPLRAWTLPRTASVLCSADGAAVAFGVEGAPLYGAQFAVEAVDPDASLLLRDFALQVCCCTTWWDDAAFASRAIEEIRRVTGGGRALCAVTGGQESGVAALLAHKALGPQLQCLFVDTGLLRPGEADAIAAYYRDEAGMDLKVIRADSRFRQALLGVADPLEKRRAIAAALQDVLREERPRLGPADVLIRGTSCNDVMFGSGEDRPTLDASLPVIEPVRELFRDEIRRTADFLGIPADLMSRQDFPASGLALRILGEVTDERLLVLRHADGIFREEVQRSGADKRLWQYFAVLCPMPEDAEGTVVCLRAVHAGGQSLAHAARLPYDVTENATERILREIPQVRRVVYDLTPSTHYAGIEWQ